MISVISKHAITILALLYCLSVVLLAGCSSPEKDFQASTGEDSIAAYEGFVDKHPASALEDSAKARIRTLRYLQNLPQAYREYLVSDVAEKMQLSSDAFVSTFGWNGEKSTWNWSSTPAYIQTGMGTYALAPGHSSPSTAFPFRNGHNKLNGKSAVGNVLFDGAWHWVEGEGITIYPGTKVIYPR